MIFSWGGFMFDITKVNLKECSLEETLTLCAYLIINTDFSDIEYINECIDKCAWKLNGFLLQNHDLVSEYFYLMDIIKKRKNRLPKKDSNRKYLKEMENKLKDASLIYENSESKDSFPEVMKVLLNDERSYLYIRKLLQRKSQIYNLKIDNKHILFYIVDKYIENFKMMIEDKKSKYINKDFLREVYFLFIKNYKVTLSKKEREEIDQKFDTFVIYLKNTLIKNNRKNAAINEVKKMKLSNYYGKRNSYLFPEYDTDNLSYEANRVTNLACQNVERENSLILDNAILFGNHAYKVENNVIHIYCMEIGPFAQEKSILNNYLETLEFTKSKMDPFIHNALSFKEGKTYTAQVYTLEFYPNGKFKSFYLDRRNVHITKRIKTIQDIDSDSKDIYNLYRKICSKYNFSITNFDIYKINELFNYFLNQEYANFIVKNKLPFIFSGYTIKEEEEINEYLYALSNIIEKLDKQDAYDLLEIIKGKVDDKHYSIFPISDGVIDMNIADHRNYLSLINQRIIIDLIYNNRQLGKNRLEKLFNEYAQKFMKIVDELNENNDYVDTESLRQNKGRLKRKIRY